MAVKRLPKLLKCSPKINVYIVNLTFVSFLMSCPVALNGKNFLERIRRYNICAYTFVRIKVLKNALVYMGEV